MLWMACECFFFFLNESWLTYSIILLHDDYCFHCMKVYGNFVGDLMSDCCHWRIFEMIWQVGMTTSNYGDFISKHIMLNYEKRVCDMQNVKNNGTYNSQWFTMRCGFWNIRFQFQDIFSKEYGHQFSLWFQWWSGSDWKGPAWMKMKNV